MAGIDVAQVIERFLGAQFGEQDAIGLHAQAGFHAAFWRERRSPCPSFE